MSAIRRPPHSGCRRRYHHRRRRRRRRRGLSIPAATASRGAVALPHLQGDAAQGPDPVFTPDGGGEGQALPDASAHGESWCAFRVFERERSGEREREGERDT